MPDTKPQHVFTVEQAKKYALEVVATWDQVDLCRFMAECHPEEKVQVGNTICTYDDRTSDFILEDASAKETGSYFDAIFATAISGLREYYPELSDIHNVNWVKSHMLLMMGGPTHASQALVGLGDQLAYEHIRYQIEHRLKDILCKPKREYGAL